MKIIEVLDNFQLGEIEVESEKNKEVKKVFDGNRRQIISIILRNNEVLAKHKAKEPITILCLAGAGSIRAGENLEEEQKLTTGTLITLEPEIEHEVSAAPEIHILVTKFKNT